MYSPGALYSLGGIFFTGRHVLSRRLYSPGGIYFTGRHALLFGMIKKNSWPQHVPSGCLYSPGGIYFTDRHMLLLGTIQKKNPYPSMYPLGACTLLEEFTLRVGMCSYLE